MSESVPSGITLAISLPAENTLLTLGEILSIAASTDADRIAWQLWLTEAIGEGKIPPRFANGRPMAGTIGYMHRQTEPRYLCRDLGGWLRTVGYDVSHATHTTGPQIAVDSPPRIGTMTTDEQRSYIGRRAKEIHKAARALTMLEVAEQIAAEMKANGYRGQRGEHLSPATVKRLLPSGFTGGREKHSK
ncbi:hypothetical protein [Cupriavidus metallidurans]|uniref:hypothetical protein n=1 Tax=Cupriavidus metallidurans TaxID=119219 RepID=UPI001BFC7CF7|nr:hypothetical protein [Cupriavidus metallidurans]QWC87778.1 hypothetical protein KB891_12075 [Cupriavidus metallidurans]